MLANETVTVFGFVFSCVQKHRDDCLQQQTDIFQGRKHV